MLKLITAITFNWTAQTWTFPKPLCIQIALKEEEETGQNTKEGQGKE